MDMHPGFIAWWQRSRGCGGAERYEAAGHCGGWSRGHAPDFDARFASDGDGGDFGAFGVRRPLRFLAHKLELKDEQIAELAAILDELKTERAQAAVDVRRSTAAFAEALAGSAFDEAKAKEIANERVKTQERLQAAVARALGRIHKLLDEEQRRRLAYLLRTGALAV
jgi:Spy/CpxP family protein refolding chaperone